MKAQYEHHLRHRPLIHKAAPQSYEAFRFNALKRVMPRAQLSW